MRNPLSGGLLTDACETVKSQIAVTRDEPGKPHSNPWNLSGQRCESFKGNCAYNGISERLDTVSGFGTFHWVKSQHRARKNKIQYLTPPIFKKAVPKRPTLLEIIDHVTWLACADDILACCDLSIAHSEALDFDQFGWRQFRAQSITASGARKTVGRHLALFFHRPARVPW